MNKALITGVTGQDGSYLAEFLLEKGYEVHGFRRRVSLPNIQRIQNLIDNFPEHFFLHYGDMTDTPSILRVLREVEPSEIYNLAAQSHVRVSFDAPEYTANADGLGCLRILEGIKMLGLEANSKFYQASTSELFGLIQSQEQTENTPFYPRSPYAVAKLYAHWITVNYREAYGLFACNGILFNHESARRGQTFVTRKITNGLARIVFGQLEMLHMGNLSAERDWGHALDYVEMQWLMLQQKAPKDYVIATGKKHSVKDFIFKSAEFFGLEIVWSGDGLDEVGIVNDIRHPKIDGLDIKKIEHLLGKKIIGVDPYFFRPTEVDVLLGDAQKARDELDWKPKIGFDQLVEEMATSDYLLVRDGRNDF